MRTKRDSHEQKENVKNTRNALKILQNTALNKENLIGRIYTDKDKLANVKHETKTKSVEDKAVQTGECTITATDLTSDEPSLDYWKKLAEKREEMLNESFEENERLRAVIEKLEEKDRISQELLEEARLLVEVLKEATSDDADATEAADSD